MSDDLVAFLRARYEDEETLAKAARLYSEENGDDANWWWDHKLARSPNERHIADWSPARVLAEVDAKRRIIDELGAARDNLRRSAANYAAWANNEPEPYPDVRGSGAESLIPGLVRAVQLLALPHASHPDYRPEWAAEAAGE